MKWLRLGFLEELSPLGLLATGLAVGAVTTPAVRKGLRGMAVGLIKGALAISEEAREASSKARGEWSRLVEEVKQERQVSGDKQGLLHGAGLGVAKAVEEIREGVGTLVAEAKNELSGLENHSPESDGHGEGAGHRNPGEDE
ncbi:hypothetical protein [Desulfotomaculum copahuensis]|uniref:DUF5132 domain-containing protein n=1 Tax=Desulfotomaculum copahuensis TaxID=1838280 RepID=A0A1B7LES7_9FIRM|nr:hypothetical protein [Desulfotomaculum copahuensis]OAT81772.1 hypothetical protein A6M21_10255 [Desulfotomaculum copahuensis]